MSAPKDARATDQGRLYHWKNEDFVSVTNVISCLDKPALVPSARKIQAEVILENMDYYAALIESKGFDKARMQASRDAKQIWDTKTEQGTMVHEAIENMVAGRHELIPAELDPWMKHLDRWLMENAPEILYSEVQVFSRAGRYAGSVDWIMRLQHGGPGDVETLVVDTKSGTAIWPEVALQLSGYRYAEFMGIGDQEYQLPEIDRCAVLHLTQDKCELVPVRTGLDVYQSFLALRDVWSWRYEVAKTVLV